MQTFTQHMAVALELANELMMKMRKLERWLAANLPEEAVTIGLDVGRDWESLWSQLDDARSLAVRHRREVSAYDGARALAQDLTSGAVVVDIGGWRGSERTVHVCIPKLAPAVEALDALATAVPEAEFTRAPAAPELRSGRRIPWGWIFLAVFAALAIALGVYEWNLVHGNKAFR